jgi:hypothetical protein
VAIQPYGEYCFLVGKVLVEAADSNARNIRNAVRSASLERLCLKGLLKGIKDDLADKP